MQFEILDSLSIIEFSQTIDFFTIESLEIVTLLDKEFCVKSFIYSLYLKFDSK